MSQASFEIGIESSNWQRKWARTKLILAIAKVSRQSHFYKQPSHFYPTVSFQSIQSRSHPTIHAIAFLRSNNLISTQPYHFNPYNLVSTQLSTQSLFFVISGLISNIPTAFWISGLISNELVTGLISNAHRCTIHKMICDHRSSTSDKGVRGGREVSFVSRSVLN